MGIDILCRVDLHVPGNLLTLAIALSIGLLPILVPGLYGKFPPNLQIILGNGLAMGTIAADFLIVDLDVPEMLPSWDLTWELVRLANRDQIVANFVAGRMRLWQGWPTDWDARALMAQVRERAAGAVAKAPIQRIHPTADAHRSRAEGRS